MLRNMSATASLPASEKRSLHVIPRDALIRRNGKDFVYTLKDGTASMTPVNVVMRSGGMIGSLSQLIRGAAILAIEDGCERITRTLLDLVPVDYAAERSTPTRPARRAVS